MNRTDLINAVTLRSGLASTQVEKVVDAFLDTISLSLACQEDVTIRNFGKFEQHLRPAAKRMNPRTGEKIDCPEKVAVSFHAAPKLKDRANGKR